MPKVRRGKKAPPEGWDLVESTLVELGKKMRQVETEVTENKRKEETSWNIFRLHHQRTRYIYEMYTKRHAISKEVYEYCIKEGYADQPLMAKWKKVVIK